MKHIKLAGLLAALAVVPFLPARGQPPAGTVMFSGVPATGIQALSALTDSVVWAAGTQGYVGITTNGGLSWRFARVPGAGDLDFRALAAFDSLHAVVANAGFPASIYRTRDGGRHWRRVFFRADSTLFIDGMVFAGRRDGVAYADPVKTPDGKRRFVLLRSTDGGRSWHQVPAGRRPVALAGEASFAASNSGICRAGDRIYLVTGGSAARVLSAGDSLKDWEAATPPMIHGKASAGIFSVSFRDQDHGVIVGGDYHSPAARAGTAALTRDGGKNWLKPLVIPGGYRSCVLYVSADTLLATGPSGTDLSTDDGVTWQPIDDQEFNVISTAPGGQRVFLGGGNGKLGVRRLSTLTASKHAGFSPVER
jgi:photosystem II stability/assembly factor-like uncharacterized protein